MSPHVEVHHRLEVLEASLLEEAEDVDLQKRVNWPQAPTPANHQRLSTVHRLPAHGELAHQTRSQLVVSHFIDVAITHENVEDLSAVLGVFGQDLEQTV